MPIKIQIFSVVMISISVLFFIVSLLTFIDKDKKMRDRDSLDVEINRTIPYQFPSKEHPKTSEILLYNDKGDRVYYTGKIDIIYRQRKNI